MKDNPMLKSAFRVTDTASSTILVGKIVGLNDVDDIVVGMGVLSRAAILVRFLQKSVVLRRQFKQRIWPSD